MVVAAVSVTVIAGSVSVYVLMVEVKVAVTARVVVDV